jgi:hypothetical protein
MFLAGSECCHFLICVLLNLGTKQTKLSDPGPSLFATIRAGGDISQ